MEVGDGDFGVFGFIDEGDVFILAVQAGEILELFMEQARKILAADFECADFLASRILHHDGGGQGHGHLPFFFLSPQQGSDRDHADFHFRLVGVDGGDVRQGDGEIAVAGFDHDFAFGEQ